MFQSDTPLVTQLSFLQTIWRGLTFSIVIMGAGSYVMISDILAPGGILQNVSGSFRPSSLSYLPEAISILSVLVVIFIWGLGVLTVSADSVADALREAKVQRGDFDAAGKAIFTRYTIVSLIQWTTADAIGFFGLFTAILTRDIVIPSGMTLLALLAMYMFRPSADRFYSIVAQVTGFKGT